MEQLVFVKKNSVTFHEKSIDDDIFVPLVFCILPNNRKSMYRLLTVKLYSVAPLLLSAHYFPFPFWIWYRSRISSATSASSTLSTDGNLFLFCCLSKISESELSVVKTSIRLYINKYSIGLTSRILSFHFAVLLEPIRDRFANNNDAFFPEVAKLVTQKLFFIAHSYWERITKSA